MMRLGISERDICRQITSYLLLAKPNCVWFHVPNEGMGYRGALKAIGMVAGAPDYVFVSANKTMLVEVKTKTGRISSAQRLFKAWCEDKGVDYRIIHSLDDLRETILPKLSAQVNASP